MLGDDDLVLRFRDGDDDAFATLVRTYANAVYGTAYNKLGDFYLAQDVAQEVFLKAYLKLKELKEPNRVGSWLFTMTRNICVDWYRRSPLITVTLDERLHEFVDDSSLEVRQALDSLPEETRLPIILFHIDGYSTREVASFLGLTPKAVENRLRRARQMLKRELMDVVDDLLKANRLGEDFVKKVDEIQRSLKTKPNDPELLHSYGCLLMHKGAELYTADDGTHLLREAIKQFEKSVSHGGTGEGEILHAQSILGETEKMIESYKAKLSQVQSDTDILHWFAMLALGYLKLDKLDEAEQAIKKATVLDENNAELLEIMGDVYGRQQRNEEALACWDRALEIKPDWIPPRFSKARHLAVIGRYKESLHEWHTIVRWLNNNGYGEDPDWTDEIARIENLKMSETGTTTGT